MMHANVFHLYTHLQPTGPAQVVIILWAEHCMIFTVTELMKLVSLPVM